MAVPGSGPGPARPRSSRLSPLHALRVARLRWPRPAGPCCLPPSLPPSSETPFYWGAFQRGSLRGEQVRSGVMPASGLPGGTALRVGLPHGGWVLSSALPRSHLCRGVWGSGRGRGLQVELRQPRELLEASAQTGQALATRQLGTSTTGKRHGARQPWGADDVLGPGFRGPVASYGARVPTGLAMTHHPVQRRVGSLLAGWADQAWVPGPLASHCPERPPPSQPPSSRPPRGHAPDSDLCPLSRQQGPSAGQGSCGFSKPTAPQSLLSAPKHRPRP